MKTVAEGTNLAFPSLRVATERTLSKPRQSGLTMVVDGLDSGWLTLNAAEDLLSLAGNYVDLIKIGWLTARFVDRTYLRRKLNLYRDRNVTSFTGGMLLEAAQLQRRVDDVIAEARDLGFACMEISDSVAKLSIDDKLRIQEAVQRRGMLSIVEVGKKGGDADLEPETVVPVIQRFLGAGAYKVILESEQVELMFAGGSVDLSAFGAIVDSVGLQNLIFEVPYGKPVSDVIGFAWWFVDRFGPNVNLANIEPRHVLAVETVRHGYGFHGGLWSA
jgi:phosphosulfolactate synthase